MHQKLLNHIIGFIPLSNEEKKEIASRFRVHSFQKKEFLLNYHDYCLSDFYILKGCAKVFYCDENGNERIIKFAVEDSWVTDLDSFLNHMPTSFSIQALEDCEVLLINLSDYLYLVKNLPAFNTFSMYRWQQGFIALQRRTMQHISLDAEERYLEFKEKYPGLEKRIPQKLIASYLGITPEFFSMLKKKTIKNLNIV